MGWLSMETRKELTAAVAARYWTSDRAKKARILDEFVDITGFHRKHAMRHLRGQEDRRPGRPGRRTRRLAITRQNTPFSHSFGRRQTGFAGSG